MKFKSFFARLASWSEDKEEVLFLEIYHISDTIKALSRVLELKIEICLGNKMTHLIYSGQKPSCSADFTSL